MKANQQNQIKYFLENIHFLLDSGMPITDCLTVIQNKNKYKNDNIKEIQNNLVQGMTFSDSLAQVYSGKIPNLILVFIKIGESCGNLSEMIKSALDTDIQISKLKNSLKGALAYPAFILVVAFTMIILIMLFIMPKLLPIFKDLHVNLPFTTRMFISFSNLLQIFGLYIMASISLVFISIFILIKKFKEFNIFLENCMFNLWGIRNIYIYYYTSLVAVCISKYLGAGYSLHDSFNLIAKSIRSKKYQEACIKMSQDLQKGKHVSEVILSAKNLFPDWAHSIEIASQTGRLDVQFYRFYLENLRVMDKFSTQIKRWSEPIMMLFVGGLIGLFAISIISPIYGAVQNANF